MNNLVFAVVSCDCLFVCLLFILFTCLLYLTTLPLGAHGTRSEYVRTS